MLAVVLIEIRSVPAEQSRGRHNPRVVKRKMSGFPTRSRAAPACGDRFRYDEHIKVLPPAVPEAVEPASETPEPLPATPASSTPDLSIAESSTVPDRQHHVRTWPRLNSRVTRGHLEPAPRKRLLSVGRFVQAHGPKGCRFPDPAVTP